MLSSIFFSYDVAKGYCNCTVIITMFLFIRYLKLNENTQMNLPLENTELYSQYKCQIHSRPNICKNKKEFITGILDLKIFSTCWYIILLNRLAYLSVAFYCWKLLERVILCFWVWTKCCCDSIVYSKWKDQWFGKFSVMSTKLIQAKILSLGKKWSVVHL